MRHQTFNADEPPNAVRDSDTEESSEELFDDYGYSTERASIATLSTIVRLTRPYLTIVSGFLPLIVIFGLLASLAEGLGVGAVVLLLSLMISGAPVGDDEGDLLSHFFQRAFEFTGGSVSFTAFVAFGLIFLRIAAISAFQIMTMMTDARISDMVRRTLFRSVLTMPFGIVSQRRYGEIMTIFDRHSWSVAEAIHSLITLALNIIIATVLGLILFSIAPGIGVIAAVGSIAMLAVLRCFNGPAKDLGDRAIEAAANMNARALHTLQGLRAVRAFGQAQIHMDGYVKASEKLRTAAMRNDLIGGLSSPISHIVYIAMIAVIGIFAHSQSMSYDVVLSAIALLYRMQPYMESIGQERLTLAGLVAPLQAVDELVCHGQAPLASNHAAQTFQGTIRFENVGFSYGRQPAPCLAGLNFTIPAQGWTLIEGDSGAGKSTIVSLLLRFYAPSNGRITVDEMSLQDIDSASWLRHIAVAGQDIELIDGSIIDNIRLGNPRASDKDVDWVIGIVGLSELLDELEAGLQTRIGERGLALSGGQRQRIGIARAMLHRPRLLVLDEATTALDLHAERAILDQLAREMDGRAVLFISHRTMDDLPIASRIRLPRHSIVNQEF